jgi:hypothetical protein
VVPSVHFDADPDASVHFDADLAFYFVAVPDLDVDLGPQNHAEPDPNADADHTAGITVWAQLHKTTYAPMIFMALCIRVLMGADT